MFGSGILEVAIGVIFVYLMISLLCSAVREGIESWTKTRAAHLEHGIRELLHDRGGQGLANEFFNHPLIYSLYPNNYEPGENRKKPKMLARGGSMPSYIPAKNFALALLDIAARGPKTDVLSSTSVSPVLSLASVRANIANLDNPAVQRVLLTAIDTAQGSLDTARANVEAWYDSGMERIAGWYKRSTQWVILVIAVVVAGVGNINTLTIADYLYNNETARAIIVERSKAAVDKPEILKQSVEQTRADLAELQLPIGWGNGYIAWAPSGRSAAPVWQQALRMLLGCLLTALAATLGAPFWFDVLKRVMVIRGTVKPQDGRVDPPPLPPPHAPASVPVIVSAESNVQAPVPALAAPDPERGMDCCGDRGLAPGEETPDEELPAAVGGVAE